MRVAYSLVAGAATASAVSIKPIQKVINMLTEMKERGIKEMKDEEVRMSAFTQWCANTDDNKTASIAKSQRDMDKASATIAKTASDSAQAQTDIEKHDGEIAVWQSDIKAARDVRGKEKTDFSATHQDYSETLSAIARAVEVLKSQSHDRAQAESLLQLSARTSSMQTTKAVLMHYLAQPEALSTDAASDESLGGARTAATGTGQDFGARTNKQAHGYEFQSGGVVDMLETLEDKFATEQKNLEDTERSAVHAFQHMVQTLTDSIENGKATIGRLQKWKGECDGKNGEAKGELADATSNRDEDKKYLAETRGLCSMKSKNFDERQSVRRGEIDAIGQAIDIIGGKTVSATTTDAHSFLQISSTAHTGNVDRVAELLQADADKYGSKLLGMLSTRVTAAERSGGDPFVKVKKMIFNMISKLKGEAAAEAEQKGWCDAELGANKITRDDKTNEVNELSAEKEELLATIAKLSDEVSNLQEEVANLKQERKEQTEDRNEESAKNAITIKESKEAEAAVANALTILNDFYASAKGPAFVQTSSSQPAGDAPETFEDEAYTGLQGSSGGVVGMLEVIQSDFARLAAETESSEAQNADQYKNFMNESEVDLAIKNTEIDNKNAMIDRKNNDLETTEHDLNAVKKELDAAQAYYDKLKPTCVNTGISYEERVAMREAEIQSLKEALSVLSQSN